MRHNLLLVVLLITCIDLCAQKSDFIVIRNKHQRTLRSYFPGSFVNADTYAGFTLNGVIRKIQNDSLYVEQQNVYQVPTQFGTPALDTVRFMIPIYYKEIRRFNYEINGSHQYKGNSMLLPKLMLYGGTGFILLELVNSAYRKESLNEGNKLATLGVAAGVAVAGLAWQEVKKSKIRNGKSVVVEYINMTK